jgi:exodeoxyribonuclease V gamma subunit
LTVGDFVVSGNISHATPHGLLFYRLARIKPKDLLRAWVEHLLSHATRSDGEPAETTIVGTESIWKFAPVSDPSSVLKNLLESYWAGLSEPLKFFPESSFAFAAADYKVATGTSGKTSRTPIDFAREKWNGNEFLGSPGESQDEYISLFFRNEEALDGDFENRAREVFGPLLENAQEVEE